MKPKNEDKNIFSTEEFEGKCLLDLDIGIKMERQRLKLEVEKAISEFINMRIESENRVVSKYDTIFSINDFEELKKRLFSNG